MEIPVKNKKGQFLGFGSLIVVGIVIVIALIAGAFFLNFIKTNLILFLGGAVILLTLIFGLKLVIEKPTGSRVGIFGFMMLIGFGMIIFSYTVQQTQFSSTFYDGDLGTISYTITNKPLFTSTEQSFFSKTNIVVGDTVYIQDQITRMIINDNFKSADIIIKKDGSKLQTIGVTSGLKALQPASGDKLFKISFTPGSSGAYNGIGSYTASLHMVLSDGSVYDSPVTNTLTVTSASNACNKNNYWDGWKVDSAITGGYLQTNKFYMIDTNCNAIYDHTDQRVVCSDGYNANNNQYKCELINVLPPVQQCDCNADLTTTCTDNSVVILKRCNNNCNLINTGLSCPNTPDMCDRDVTKTCSDGSVIILQTCSGTPKILTQTNIVCPSLPLVQGNTTNSTNSTNNSTSLTCDQTNTCATDNSGDNQQTNNTQGNTSSEAALVDYTLVVAIVVITLFVALIIITIIMSRKVKRRRRRR